MPQTPDAPTAATIPPDALAALGAVGFIGVGAAGTALARALAARGARVVAVVGRLPGSAAVVAASIPGCRAVEGSAAVLAAAETVILAVPDDAIATLDATLDWRATHTVAHLSGARGIAALARARERRAGVAALHPLMLFPRPPLDAPTALARLAGCAWALEASDTATAARMEALVAALAGRVIALDGAARVPYHLAAVLASNYIVALLGAAVGLWEGFGVEGEAALAALLPLLRATVESLERQGPVRALTGPVARGDAGTIAAHLSWLAAHADDAVAAGGVAGDGAVPLDVVALGDAYRALARLAIPLARARGALDEAAARALEKMLRNTESGE
ncbi:MAG TPA: DUF2520 domain-containing protein [Ktedonobacterales bacterium]